MYIVGHRCTDINLGLNGLDLWPGKWRYGAIQEDLRKY